MLGAAPPHMGNGVTLTVVIIPAIPKDAPGRLSSYGQVMKPSPALRVAAHRFAPR